MKVYWPNDVSLSFSILLDEPVLDIDFSGCDIRNALLAFVVLEQMPDSKIEVRFANPKSFELSLRTNQGQFTKINKSGQRIELSLCLQWDFVSLVGYLLQYFLHGYPSVNHIDLQAEYGGDSPATVRFFGASQELCRRYPETAERIDINWPDGVEIEFAMKQGHPRVVIDIGDSDIRNILLSFFILKHISADESVSVHCAKTNSHKLVLRSIACKSAAIANDRKAGANELELFLSPSSIDLLANFLLEYFLSGHPSSDCLEFTAYCSESTPVIVRCVFGIDLIMSRFRGRYPYL